MENVQKRSETGNAKGRFSMPNTMKLDAPTLRVTDIRESLAFYREGFGLTVRKDYADQSEGLRVYELALRSASEPLLILKDDPAAKMPRHDFAGLYHYAVLVPTRNSLASTYLALGNSGMAFDGFADHYVSEALYLHDVEQNGIEVYADRSRETWSAFRIHPSSRGATDVQRFAALNKPLDFQSLLRELSKRERSDPAKFADGARIGHVHLRVTNLERSVKFYHETLGLDVVANIPEIGAAFLSVNGYHHHLGLNTWHSREGTAHRGREAGLDKFAMTLPNDGVLDRLETSLSAHSSKFERDKGRLLALDPDGIRIELGAKRE